jgi:hypothetical protein
LNVVVFAVTGFIGVKFLYQGMEMLSQEDEEGLKTRMSILRFWLILYAFVGTQLAWTLRPFFGSPGTPFELFREMQGNFYLDIIHAFGEIFGFH